MKVTHPERIRRARQKLDYSQVDLARLVGCTQQYISAMETGADTDVSDEVALRICRRLGIDLEYAFEQRESFSVSANPISKPVTKKGRAA